MTANAGPFQLRGWAVFVAGLAAVASPLLPAPFAFVSQWLPSGATVSHRLGRSPGTT
ncbi:MAG TPA: hypothetical protein VHC18_26150 [Amycolatopsis sp.]|nr:hypothetical protein [Amycolatopsis sp.]